MPTLNEIITAHETKFADFVNAELKGKKIPRYMLEHFETYHLNVISQLFNIKIKDGSIAKDPRLEASKSEEVISAEKPMDEAIKDFWRGFEENYPPDVDCMQAIRTRYASKTDYLNATTPITDAHKQARKTLKKAFVGDYRTFYDNVVEACEKARKQMADSIYESTESLSKRYKIGYIFFVLGEDNQYVKKEECDELKGDELKDIFAEQRYSRSVGRKVTDSSFFHKLCKYFSEDKTVSPQQFFIDENKSGITCSDISVKGTVIIDYKRQKTALKREQTEDAKKPLNRKDITGVLFPADYNEKEGSAAIYFGGDRSNKYQLLITLEKRTSSENEITVIEQKTE